MRNTDLPSHIYLYLPSQLPQIKINEIADYIKKLLPKILIEQREGFFSFFLNQRREPSFLGEIARAITACRVHDIGQKIKEFLPLPAEIEYEKRRLMKTSQMRGVIYDGFCFQNMCGRLIREEERKLSFCHMVFTDQRMATFDENNKHYHLRVGIYGTPNIISPYGIIEALAKPRDYYLKLQMGIDPLRLKEEFSASTRGGSLPGGQTGAHGGEGMIFDEDDPRITEILKGYCAQGLFYHITGSAFCDDEHCRLYNAHWQKEVICAQLTSKSDFCPRHEEIVSEWQKNL
ncbi:MAG: hypothetical protein JSW40_00455 [Candidatus Omnitrophota bacterium]|nr:MAG: hypothetical protein JSW40_00455 [Candidatus Omnitrophota bacterium]